MRYQKDNRTIVFERQDPYKELLERFLISMNFHRALSGNSASLPVSQVDAYIQYLVQHDDYSENLRLHMANVFYIRAQALGNSDMQSAWGDISAIYSDMIKLREREDQNFDQFEQIEKRISSMTQPPPLKELAKASSVTLGARLKNLFSKSKSETTPAPAPTPVAVEAQERSFNLPRYSKNFETEFLDNFKEALIKLMDAILERGERLDVLEEKSEDLHKNPNLFKKQGTPLAKGKERDRPATSREPSRYAGGAIGIFSASRASSSRSAPTASGSRDISGNNQGLSFSSISYDRNNGYLSVFFQSNQERDAFRAYVADGDDLIVSDMRVSGDADALLVCLAGKPYQSVDRFMLEAKKYLNKSDHDKYKVYYDAASELVTVTFEEGIEGSLFSELKAELVKVGAKEKAGKLIVEFNRLNSIRNSIPFYLASNLFRDAEEQRQTAQPLRNIGAGPSNLRR